MDRSYPRNMQVICGTELALSLPKGTLACVFPGGEILSEQSESKDLVLNRICGTEPA
jgi:hypothetical protein